MSFLNAKNTPTNLRKKKLKTHNFKKKMADGYNIYEIRSWMYSHKDSAGRVTETFLRGLETFMQQAGSTPLTQESGKMLRPCRNAKIQNLHLVKLYGST
ncbi:hypothetical protein Bca101_017808 [Brassica carinata]